MATATDSPIQSLSAGIAERVSAFVHDLAAFSAQYSTYKTTLRELSNLSDRDLDDLGIHRSAIHDIAREAAFGK